MEEILKLHFATFWSHPVYNEYWLKTSPILLSILPEKNIKIFVAGLIQSHRFAHMFTNTNSIQMRKVLSIVKKLVD